MFKYRRGFWKNKDKLFLSRLASKKKKGLICNKQYLGYIVGNICNFSDNEEVLYSICRYRDISVMETPAGKIEGEKPVKNITDMSLMVWARGGVQWASGLPFSRVCFNSTWDFNSVSCFNLPRTILRGFVIKSTKSSSALFLTLQQNTGLCQNKNNAK